MKKRLLTLLLTSFAALASTNAAVQINEINFHHQQALGSPDNKALEWIELHNTDTLNPVNLSGWKLTNGVTFTIPNDTTIAADGYIVIAADVAAFQTAYPAFTGTVVGGWTGNLSNGGEQIQLENAAGVKQSDVTYATSGDWATRVRTAVSFSHQGWDWECPANGDGPTLELINPALGDGNGPNWTSSANNLGTPGAINSRHNTETAPLIKNVKVKPEIPRSTDPITVSCDIEAIGTMQPTELKWKLDADAAFQTINMVQNTQTGRWEATINPQTNAAIVEWYISASNTTAARTWPAPSRTSNPGVAPETYGQVNNALVQVDDTYNPALTFRTAADQPIYRIIMKAADRNELVQLQTTSGQEDSDARFNATFVSHDGAGTKINLLAGISNRGQGSALGPPNNYHVSFRGDDIWNGRKSFGINCRYGYVQALGQALVARAGLATQDAAVVKVRVNGTDLAETGNRMYSRYVRVEGRGGDWAENHYPDDPEGNFYRLDDHDTGGTNPPGDLGSGEFRYEGEDPNAYSDTFIKETNKTAFDYSDIINLAKIVSAPATGGSAGQPAISDAAYPAAVAAVLDLDNFYKFIATDTLIANIEGGLTSGRGDDASIYRGISDPRFRFIHHDLDTIFDAGDTTGGATRNIFTYDGSASPGTGVIGLTRLFNHPQLVPRYYAALLDATNTWFNNTTIDPIVDQILAGWVPAIDAVAQNRSINDLKAFVATRRANVLAMIPQTNTLAVAVGGTTTAEGYQRTNDGSATFSGNFNVARVYSITVNGIPATTNYRTTTAPAATAGTWNLAVPAGGGTVLHPGLNRVVTKFWSGPGGTGTALATFTNDILFQPAAATYTNVAGTVTAGSLRLTAPATYIPGKPFIVRADVLDSTGSTDRTVWDATVSLSTTAPGVTLPTIPLYNGMGSALVTLGGGSGGANTQLIVPGGTLAAPNTTNTNDRWRMLDSGGEPAATWKTDLNFDDSTWIEDFLQAGNGDADERKQLANVNTANTTRRAFYFRKKFNLTSIPTVGQLQIRAVVDDGAVFYLNGTPVFTDNMPAGTPTITTPASSNRGGAAESQIRTFDITAYANLLTTGDNLFAVEIHNYSQATPTVINSADLSFDCELIILPPSADPGDLTLNGSVATTGGTFTGSKALTSLTATPTMTNVSGTLAAGTTTWSGVINVTGDVTVPTGATLDINPGTQILIAGDATAGSTAGARIIVNGTLNSNGTFALPVAVTAFNATDRFGGFLFSAAQPSTMSYTLINHAGHTTGVGHTSRGPFIRLTGSSLNFDDSVIADGPAKAIYTSGTLDLNIRRSLMERMITGPELGDGTALLCEDTNIQRILPDYRESNAATPDDEDCLYVHNGAGRSVIVRRSVFARCGDDVFDCLGGPITVEDSILREGWDKGMSLLNNDLTITRTQIINCDKAIVPKSQNADTRTVTASFLTIVSENHDTTLAPWGYSVPPSSPDPDTPSTGFYTQNKAGQSNTGATLAINAKNCIVIAQSPVLVDAPYTSTPSVLTYCNTALLDYTSFTWPGTGNITADPLFADAANGNYRITATSPCRDTGDPATTDPDTTPGDMGALYFGGGVATGGTVNWTAANGPYRITANSTVPAGVTLNIGPGTPVYFDQNVRLTVNGRILAQGTANSRITFSHVPGTIAAGDADPIKLNTQTGPPKWGGIRITDSMAQENIVRYADFINAQGTDPATTENYGSLGFIRSWGWADNLTFAGTHLRMLYGRNSKLTVTYCTFPDMFIFDPALGTSGRIEEPTTDFIGTADNRMEPLKVEFPTSDTELAGQTSTTDPLAAYPNGLPRNGHWRVYFNNFNGNRGHQDVFDADSGRWALRDAVTNLQPNGQFLLDCRYNHFRGLAGDEHIDLGGDAYIASNIMENATKDFWTNDTGYSNAISSGDKGTGTTIFVVRNFCYDLDHVINCKASTATIFEHNTVANIHDDFNFVGSTVNQSVICAPINFYVSGDGNNPSYGDGAYTGFNIFSNMPHIFSRPDTRDGDTGPGINNVNDITTQIEFFHNLLDQIDDPVVGPNHPGGFFSGTYGPNQAGAPGFTNPAAEDYTLLPQSLARSGTPFGFDYGATIPEWAYLVGGPTAEGGTTNSTDASFTVGGPGLVAFKWRLDGGTWSAPVQIGNGGVLVRGSANPRQHTLALTGLTAGTHTLEILGQDAAGNWQGSDPARNYDGLPQAAPTTRTWTVDPAFIPLRLSELLANPSVGNDQLEIQNLTAAPVSLAGWTITNDPAVPGKIALTGTVAANGLLAYTFATNAAFTLDKDGGALYLYQSGQLRDSIAFGPQITGKSIGRNVAGVWTLCTATLGAANTPTPAGDFSAVRISEWLADSQVLYTDDWIELLNTAAFPAALQGLTITDNRSGNGNRYVFPALSYLDAGAYLRLIADGGNSAGHLPFSLDAEYQIITLLGANNTLLDTVAFYPQTTDYSMGRDGAGVLTFYELPTRNFLNGTTDPGYANALAIMRGLRVTEIMFNGFGGSDYDFIELRNVGAASFDLAGVSFSKGVTYTFGTNVLAPGQSIVVCKNLTKFQGRYGTAARAVGNYTGQLDNAGEGIALQLPPPFDAYALNFDYNDTWQPLADGLGRSLVIISPTGTLAKDWGDQTAWTVSATDGGDPDGASLNLTSYSGWMVAHQSDLDEDGLALLMEAALGTEPNNPNPGSGGMNLPQPSVAPGGFARLTLWLPDNAAAVQGHGLGEITYRIQATSSLDIPWTTIATKTTATNWTGTATVTVGPSTSGYTPVTITDTIPDANRFLRLTVEF